MALLDGNNKFDSQDIQWKVTDLSGGRGTTSTDSDRSSSLKELSQHGEQLAAGKRHNVTVKSLESELQKHMVVDVLDIPVPGPAKWPREAVDSQYIRSWPLRYHWWFLL